MPKRLQNLHAPPAAQLAVGVPPRLLLPRSSLCDSDPAHVMPTLMATMHLGRRHGACCMGSQKPEPLRSHAQGIVCPVCAYTKKRVSHWGGESARWRLRRHTSSPDPRREVCCCLRLPSSISCSLRGERTRGEDPSPSIRDPIPCLIHPRYRRENPITAAVLLR